MPPLRAQGKSFTRVFSLHHIHQTQLFSQTVSLFNLQLGQTQQLAVSKAALHTSYYSPYSLGIPTELAPEAFGKTGSSG